MPGLLAGLLTMLHLPGGPTNVRNHGNLSPNRSAQLKHRVEVPAAAELPAAGSA
jgi:hypothetical protein